MASETPRNDAPVAVDLTLLADPIVSECPGCRSKWLRIAINGTISAT
jgi:hypothetical protein